MSSPDLIDEIIENSKIDTALETSVGAGASAIHRKMNPSSTLEKAWKLRRNNQLFLQLLREGEVGPTATYRISFSFPLRRITAWRYEEEGFKLRSKKMKLLEFFVLLAKLKEALNAGRLSRDQLVFNLNQFTLTDNPLFVIDCVMMMYQQRKAKLALKYAEDRAEKRFAHRFDSSGLFLDTSTLAGLTEAESDKKFKEFKASRVEAASSGGGGEDPLDQIDPFLSGPPTSGPERNDDAFMDAFIQEGKEEFERKAAEAELEGGEEAEDGEEDGV